MFPPKLAISLTNLDEIIWFSTSDIKNIVSILELSFLFIPANWNSYSKSETALNPLIITVALYFLHNSIVKLSNAITLIFFLSNFRSLNNELLIMSTLSLIEKK